MSKHAKTNSPEAQKITWIQTEKLETTVVGIATVGKLGSKQDVSIDELGKGVTLKSPNGHRWRLQVTDAGNTSWVDLDA